MRVDNFYMVTSKYDRRIGLLLFLHHLYPRNHIYIFRQLALVEILEIEDDILDFTLLNVVIFLFLFRASFICPET